MTKVIEKYEEAIIRLDKIQNAIKEIKDWGGMILGTVSVGVEKPAFEMLSNFLDVKINTSDTPDIHGVNQDYMHYSCQGVPIYIMEIDFEKQEEFIKNQILGI